MRDVVCDKCGAKMVVKEGRYGKFLACPNYPACKNIKKFVEVVGKCPKCGADVLKKTSRSGKTFYGRAETLPRLRRRYENEHARRGDHLRVYEPRLQTSRKGARRR